MQRVMDRHDGAICEMRNEEIEVEFGSEVGVIAVDPEKANGAIPALGDLFGSGAMNFNILFHACAAQGGLEIVER